jgi:cell division septation protein DedD
MKNKETGEFELLIGNGQIISGFFILALLLAVFFAMGFIVARAKYQQEPATAATISSTPASETRVPAAAPEIPAAKPPEDTAREDTAKTEAPPQPAVQPPAETAKPERAEPTPAAVPAETAQGTYWQISATANQEAARALQQTIKDMGLPVTLSQGPNKLTRVLVGPYTDTSTMAKVKTQLENAGLQPVKHQQ